MKKDYSDIIDLPRPVSGRHAPMSRHDRAAQFAPFAALTGYDAVIAETGRLTDGQVELTEGKKEMLDGLLREIVRGEVKEDVTITYFRPDIRKRGGAYIKKTGRIKKADALEHLLILTDGTVIPINDIYDISLQG